MPPRSTISQEKPTRMNGLERDYALVLDARRQAGEIRDFGFARVRLRLGNGAWFKPDFDVTLANGALEFHETKGHQREAAISRLKIAASMFPWAFVLVRRENWAWTFQRLQP